MLVLITYDINTEAKDGKNRLRKVAKHCQDYGQRVQNSVFECSVNAAEYRKLKDLICGIINYTEDSVRFYNLGNNYNARIEHFGTKESYDPNGTLII